ncbi:hypothetical protein A2U01_0100167, partial [Trifolium medium]|nr:hypothetical protein [Trifolium medium]
TSSTQSPTLSSRGGTPPGTSIVENHGPPLPVGLEKPPAMDICDGSTDPVDHIKNIEAVLEYRNVRGSIKCKMFPTT